MLVLLYSDTNYVLDGFEAEYSITDCQSNCSGHGVCAAHRCICDGGWGGVDCSQPLCPKGCSKEIGGGYCDRGRCVCNPGFSGLTCSLNEKDPLGNKLVTFHTNSRILLIPTILCRWSFGLAVRSEYEERDYFINISSLNCSFK